MRTPSSNTLDKKRLGEARVKERSDKITVSRREYTIAIECASSVDGTLCQLNFNRNAEVNVNVNETVNVNNCNGN